MEGNDPNAQNGQSPEVSAYQARIAKHFDDAKSREFYSVQRIDLLIISLSGGGLYVTFETIKFLMSEHICADRCFLKIAGISFVLSILSNFISQITAYQSNKHEACWAELEERDARGEDISEEKQTAHSKASEEYNWWTQATNYTAAGLMVGGIAVLVAFYSTFL